MDESDNASNVYIRDGTIYINTAGDRPYFNVAVHEVLHGLKKVMPDSGTALKSQYTAL